MRGIYLWHGRDVKCLAVLLLAIVAPSRLQASDTPYLRKRLPLFTVSDVAVIEGDAGEKCARFIVRLQEEQPVAISLKYSTVDYTALASQDYLEKSGEIEFSQGDIEQVVEVTLLGDRSVEPTEVFFVDLKAGHNLGMQTCRGVCSILTDDLGGRGGKIAFDSQASHQRFQAIYTMNADGSERSRLTDGLAVDRVPEFCPDGKKIAFVSSRDGNSEIYVMNADGTSQTRITHHDATDSYPRFSPDGKWLVFFSDRAGSNDVFLVASHGGTEPQQLTVDTGSDCDPAFSHDGSWITFSSNRSGEYKIYAMDLDGSRQRRLTESPGAEIHSTVSPDGKRIVYRGNLSGEFQAHLLDVDNAAVAQLSRQPGSVRHPSFSPDGKSVIFHEVSSPGVASIQVVQIETGKTKELTDDSAANLNAVWAPGEVNVSLLSVRKSSLWSELRTYRLQYLVLCVLLGMAVMGCAWRAIRIFRHRNPW
jgi:TolB protein